MRASRFRAPSPAALAGPKPGRDVPTLGGAKAPKLGEGGEPPSAGAISRAFQRVQEQLDALKLSKRPALITKDTTLRAGESVRISPRSATLFAKLPKCSAENFGQTITISLERPAGTLKISAERPDTVNGVRSAPYTTATLITLTSNGVDQWVSTNQLPTTSPGGAALEAQYVLGAAHTSLPNAAVGTDTPEINFVFIPAGIATWILNTASVAFSKLADLSGLSVLGRAANSAGVMAAITATAARQTLRNNDAGTALEWGNPVEVRNNANTDLGDAFSLRFNNGTNTTAATGFAAGQGTLQINVDDYPLSGLADQAANTFVANITNVIGPPTAVAGTSVAGAGLTYSVGGILAVGAGTGLTVNANDVQLSTGAAESFFGNFTAGAAVGTYRAGSSVAGAGLTYTAGGTLAVGAGTNVTVNANDVAVDDYPLSGLADQSARSVVANATNASAPPTAVQSSAARQAFMSNSAGTALSWRTVELADLESIGNNRILVNVSGGAAPPTANTIASLLGTGLTFNAGTQQIDVSASAFVDEDAHIYNSASGIGFRKSRHRDTWWEDFDYTAGVGAVSTSGGSQAFGNTNWYLQAVGASGSCSQPAPTAFHLGLFAITTGATNTNAIQMYRGVGGTIGTATSRAAHIYMLEACMSVDTAVASTLAEFGWRDSAGANYIEFYYDSSVGGTWHTYTEEASAITDNDTGISASPGAFNTYTILQESAGTIDFYLDDVLEATHTTNVPDSETGSIFFRIMTRTSAGKTLNIDYVCFESQDLGTRTA